MKNFKEILSSRFKSERLKAFCMQLDTKYDLIEVDLNCLAYKKALSLYELRYEIATQDKSNPAYEELIRSFKEIEDEPEIEIIGVKYNGKVGVLFASKNSQLIFGGLFDNYM